jgi:SAM-dependent methyltransferase
MSPALAVCRRLRGSSRLGVRALGAVQGQAATPTPAPFPGLLEKLGRDGPARPANEDWSSFSVEQWRSAAYCAKSFFAQLSEDTTDFVGGLCDELGGASEHGPLLVEVGCGTGDALLPLFAGGGSRCRFACGMDFNPSFISYCREALPEECHGRVRHFVGDAQDLVDLCHRELPEEWQVRSRPKIVTCVGNTIGIMPQEVRGRVYQQMKQFAGRDGYMVVVYWNGNKFGDAVQNFYHKNPQLCGEFTGTSIDLNTCTLTTPSGYSTHWTKPEEARDIFEKEIGAQVVKLEERGNGVLVAARMI